MTRKTSTYARKRAHRKPRASDAVTPLGYVMNGFLPVTVLQEQVTAIQLAAHAALDEMRAGRGTRTHADKVIGVLNMAEALTRVNPQLGSDWRDEIRAGQDALLSMLVRGVRNGDRFVFTGPELTAVNLVLEIHDAQLERCTIEMMQKALTLIMRERQANRMRSVMQQADAPPQVR